MMPDSWSRENNNKFKRLYKKWFWIDSWQHHFQVTGRWGGVHFHVGERAYDGHYTAGASRLHSGVEFHYADNAPNYTDCSVIDGLCWHDGTSMGAEPYVESWLRGDEDGIWSMLRSAMDRFEPCEGGSDDAD